MMFRDPFLLVSRTTRSDRSGRRTGFRANAFGLFGLRRGEVGEVEEIGGTTKECSDDQVCRNARCEEI